MFRRSAAGDEGSSGTSSLYAWDSSLGAEAASFGVAASGIARLEPLASERLRGSRGLPRKEFVAQRSSSPTARVLLRYMALQIPGLVACVLGAIAAHEWLEVPLEIAVGTVLLWIVKDAVLFPFVRTAYEPAPGRPHGDLLDAIGIAHDGLSDQEGYIRLGPELWRARRAPGCPPLAPGEAVRVVGVDGLTLTVDSASSRSA